MSETNLSKWFQENQRPILKALLDERRRIMEMNLPDYNLDDTQLLLSEMEICGATENMPLPPGYRTTHGLIGINGEPKPSYHIFAINDRDEIIDVTAGQVVTSERRLNPDEGIRNLISKAPELFTTIGDVVALHGHVDIIRDRLGIKYDWLK